MGYAPPTGPGMGSYPQAALEVAGGQNPAINGDCGRCTGYPVDLATGAQFEAATDLAVPGRGIPLAFTRTYDTRRAADGA